MSTFSFAPASSGSYLVTVTVTDSSGATSAQSSPATVTVNSALVTPSASASSGTVDQGQTSTLSVTGLSGGTTPYSYQWLQKIPGAGSYSNISGATSSSYSFDTSQAPRLPDLGVLSYKLQTAPEPRLRLLPQRLLSR